MLLKTSHNNNRAIHKGRGIVRFIGEIKNVKNINSVFYGIELNESRKQFTNNVSIGHILYFKTDKDFGVLWKALISIE